MTDHVTDLPAYSELIRSGDRLTWAVGPMEPLELLGRLNAQMDTLPRDLSVLLNLTLTETVDAEALARHFHIKALGGSVTNRRYQAFNALDVLPVNYSQLPKLIREDPLRPDVVLLQLAAGAPANLSLMVDHLAFALDTARVVAAEINDQLPVTFGASEIDRDQIDHVIEVSRPPIEVPSRPARDAEKRVAELVNRLIKDGDTLQMGVGSLPDAILEGLANKRDLGIHTGTMGDRMMQLMQAGVVTNRRKSIDVGKTVTGVLMGTRDLYKWAHLNQAIEMRAPDYTHDSLVMGGIDNLVAINSAIEIDLTGQVNAEVAGDRHVGLIGGSGDFTRGALRSPGGRSILVMDATARRGTASRVVAKLARGTVTTSRGDADVVVTEYGMAELRGRTVSERAVALIEVAHPNFRAELKRAADDGLM